MSLYKEKNKNLYPKETGKVRERNMTREQLKELPDKGVGKKRRFEFSEKDFIIREVIEDPKFKLKWNWTTTIDSITKERKNNTRIHTFYRVEVLTPIDINDDLLKLEDIVLLGFSLDQKIMVIPIDNYDKILSESQKFKKLLRGD